MWIRSWEKLKRELANRLPVRPTVARASRGFICPICDVLLADGVVYEVCPACDTPVDWVDTTREVWACAGCDAMVNASPVATATCQACQRALIRVHDPARGEADLSDFPSLSEIKRALRSRWFISAAYITSLVPLLILSLEPEHEWLLVAVAGPLVFAPALFGLLFLGLFGASFVELRALLAQRNVRVVHGLEHATLKILEGQGASVVGGQTWESSFDIYLDGDPEMRVEEDTIHAAFEEAVKRLLAGETELAYDPRCGTSVMTGALIIALLGVLAGAIGIMTHLSAVAVLGIVFGFSLVLALTPRRLGLSAQRVFTVSTRFARATLVRVVLRPRRWRLLRFEVFVQLELDATAVPNASTGLEPG